MCRRLLVRGNGCHPKGWRYIGVGLAVGAPDVFQGAQACKNHFAESGGIFAQHTLGELRARGADLLRRVPFPAKVGRINFVERAGAVGGGSCLVQAAGIQLRQSAHILRG